VEEGLYIIFFFFASNRTSPKKGKERKGKERKGKERKDSKDSNKNEKKM